LEVIPVGLRLIRSVFYAVVYLPSTSTETEYRSEEVRSCSHAHSPNQSFPLDAVVVENKKLSYRREAARAACC